MQQTKKYRLNLIETSDTFSPDPLNENAQKLETALAAKAEAAQAATDHAALTDSLAAARAEAAARDTALDARVTALEVHKIAVGTYIGDGENQGDAQFISVGFTPAVVISDLASIYRPTGTLSTSEYPNNAIQIVSGGFMAKRSSNEEQDTISANTKDRRYRYVAIC